MIPALRTPPNANGYLSYRAQFRVFLFAWLVPTAVVALLLLLASVTIVEGVYSVWGKAKFLSFMAISVLFVTAAPLATGALLMRVFLRFGWGGWLVPPAIGTVTGFLMGNLVGQQAWAVAMAAGLIYAAALWAGLYYYCPKALRQSNAAPRPATPSELPAFADLWHDAWVEAHADHVPADLLRLRTRESFLRRLETMGDGLRVLGSAENPVGFYVIDGAKLDQLFIALSERGSGVAADLLADAEARMSQAGVTEAYLHCLPQNKRAARFYEKGGWRNCGVEPHELESLEGPFKLDVLVYRKTL